MIEASLFKRQDCEFAHGILSRTVLKKSNYLALVPAERYVCSTFLMLGFARSSGTVCFQDFYKHTVPLERGLNSYKKTN
jgi:hypothetical protein